MKINTETLPETLPEALTDTLSKVILVNRVS